MLKKKCMVCGNLIRDEDKFCRYHKLLEDKLTKACCYDCGKRGVDIIIGSCYYCQSCYRLNMDADGIIMDAFAKGMDPEMELALAFWKEYFRA